MPNMNEMLKSIIEMDKLSRKQAAQAQADKEKAVDEAGSIRAKLIEERLALAKTQANDIRKEYEADISLKLKAKRDKNEEEKARLSANFAKNRNHVVQELFEQITK
ncbi:MAG TPA: hypothetical protein PKW24_02500 [Clostridiales bacterium]|nr:hypothetical protein [Clostridiales bacterium]